MLLKKEHGEAVAAAVLVKIVAELISFFNVGKSMNDLQLAETVKLIIKEFYFLKLEDLKLCFDGMKVGRYLQGGRLYDRLDGQIIMLALREYTEERVTTAEVMNDEKHQELKDEKPEAYIIQIGDNYFAAHGNEYFEEPRKDLAMRFDWATAMRIKTMLVKGDYKHNPGIIKVKDANKAEIGLIEYLKEKDPKLAAQLEAIDKKKEPNKIESARLSIELDDNLTPLQKENKKRELAGLGPLNQEEFELSQELLQRTINKGKK